LRDGIWLVRRRVRRQRFPNRRLGRSDRSKTL
jgi:hypothetical protein